MIDLYLDATINIKTTNFDKFGNRTDGSSETTIDCRIIPNTDIIFDQNNKKKQLSYTVFMKGAQVIDPNAEIEIDSKWYQIHKIVKGRGLITTEYTEVIL